MTLTQLALEIGLQDDMTFANYCSKTNKIAYDCIKQISQGDGEQFAYLWGEEGVGKTHLLQAACHMASIKGNSAFYLPLDTIDLSLGISQLQGLENISLVCLDNIHVIAKNSLWEEEIFYLFNKIKNKQNKLLITGSTLPTNIPINLSDLKSRLSWGVVYQLSPLNEENKLMVIKKRAKYRGLELDDIVGHFLMHRCSRSMHSLLDKLDLLDKASMAEQRKLTIPFVKKVLEL